MAITCDTEDCKYNKDNTWCIHECPDLVVDAMYDEGPLLYCYTFEEKETEDR